MAYRMPGYLERRTPASMGKFHTASANSSHSVRNSTLILLADLLLLLAQPDSLPRLVDRALETALPLPTSGALLARRPLVALSDRHLVALAAAAPVVGPARLFAVMLGRVDVLGFARVLRVVVGHDVAGAW